ncbi:MULTISPECIES: signal peptidase II [unclassified Veillonella]|uniref:signal peptidase II n=1 Tax=unclassified Veillonella TaxID=2630086 RepID=UPI000CF471F9|nr:MULTISPECIES: signal peptidase II [unclassified Veillonella]MBS5755789.1 signal peptidase II [Veillonella sp.]PQL19936.1 signal peptidase II [Veillonella sp. T34266-5]
MKREYNLFYFIAIIWLVLDQASKYYVMNHFALGESLPVIQNLFHLTYIINRGAAFGMLTNQRWFFLAVAFVLIIVYGFYRKRVNNGPLSLRVGTALLIAGAIGNGIDRYVLHGVVDFFDFRIWPIFNIADIGICVGVVCVIYYLLTSEHEEK